MSTPLLTLPLRVERDVVLGRQRAREVAEALGFERQDQTRLATAVSEIARNAVSYAREGKLELELEGRNAPQVLVVRITDRGPGIANLTTILEGRYQSRTGMGRGILGTRALVDAFEIGPNAGGGTRVAFSKLLPRYAGFIDAAAVRRLIEELEKRGSRDAFEELQRQNQEVMLALEELGRRQAELGALNRELEDTNRGVVALYAELDEKADHLRRADEIKSRFLSNMSHEFRTPVNSILALARMLLDHTDGNLSSEQERQVTFIRKAADGLLELVNDLLDLAKVEAGKIEIRPVEFDVGHLFGTLRGMLRPLLVGESVSLVFDEPEDLPPLHTDEPKVSQILRNLVSNALKFTERGEVRVSAHLTDDGRAVSFAVTDTGLGIAPENHERIFQEFAQIDSPVQRRVQGTGLGLPLCRKLAGLLGGHVGVQSTLGLGSTFTAVIPLHFEDVAPQQPEWVVDERRLPILVVEDAADTILGYEKLFANTEFQPLFARNTRDARHALGAFQPRAIVLDILLRGEDTWSFLTELRRRQDLERVPVILVTTLDEEAKALALGADFFFTKPVDRIRLLQALTARLAPQLLKRVLVADDEEIFRYLLRQHLTTPTHLISEAANGNDTLEMARANRPDVICLDLVMPDLTGLEVLRRLRGDAETRDIPVVIVTSKVTDDAELAELRALSSGLLHKDALSRETALQVIDTALSLVSR